MKLEEHKLMLIAFLLSSEKFEFLYQGNSVNSMMQKHTRVQKSGLGHKSLKYMLITQSLKKLPNNTKFSIITKMMQIKQWESKYQPFEFWKHLNTGNILIHFNNMIHQP